MDHEHRHWLKALLSHHHGISVYMAGPLFTLSERNFNSQLAHELNKLLPADSKIILPQDECAKYVVNTEIDIDGISNECVNGILRSRVVFANLNGPTVDDGTSLEVGYAIRDGVPVIGYRDDWRASGEGKFGLNAMFAKVDKVVFIPPNIETIEEYASLLFHALYELVELK